MSLKVGDIVYTFFGYLVPINELQPDNFGKVKSIGVEHEESPHNGDDWTFDTFKVLTVGNVERTISVNGDWNAIEVIDLRDFLIKDRDRINKLLEAIDNVTKIY
jgi:hypothetical protein